MNALHLTIATAGHIDHGKSALVEALTGSHPDRLKDEQARGISIELGFAHTQIGDTTVSFVDVPGHERFVRHMLAGIGGIDGLLFVVAADASVMPQTREHLAIAGLLGVPRGVIALTKADLVDDDLVGLVRLEVEDLVAGTSLEGAQIVPVSARTGQGLDALRTALLDLAQHRAPRDISRPPRLPVDRVFTVRGFGTVVTGTLWTGRLQVDDEIDVLPGGARWRVRTLQVHGRPASEAVAGQRVAVNLAGAARDDVRRGDVLAGPEGLAVTRRIDARLSVLPGVEAVRHGARVHVHLGTTEILGRLSVLGPADAAAGSLVPAGQAGWVRVRLETPVATARGDRFVVRTYSPVTTAGGGVVIDPIPPRRTSRLRAAERLDQMAPEGDGLGIPSGRLLVQFVEEGGVAGIPRVGLAARLGVAPAEAATLVATALAGNEMRDLSGRLVAPVFLRQLAGQVLEMVDAHHVAEPASDGLPRQSVRARLGRRGGGPAVDAVITQLLEAGDLALADDRLARPAHLAARTQLVGARQRVLDAASAAGLGALTHEEVHAAAGLPQKDAEAVVRHLVRDDRLVRMANLYVDAAVLAGIVTDLRAEHAAGALENVEVGWFKERYGVTRRTAIPLLEWLDRQRVTRRVGDVRVVLAP